MWEKYRDLLKDWLRLEGSELYVSRQDIKFSFAVTDSIFSLSLFLNNGVFDAKHDVVSRGASAVTWGESIFAHYAKQSEKLTCVNLQCPRARMAGEVPGNIRAVTGITIALKILMTL